MTVLLSPVMNQTAFTDVDGNPLAGGLIYQYEAGSFSVLQETYTDATGLVGNANPIVLNSAGQLTTAIWLTAGLAYNLVLTTSDGITVLKSFDDVVGVQPVAAGGDTTTNLWVDTPTVSYLSPTQFLVAGNVTTEYAVGNRARVTVTGGYRYGTVSAVSFSSPNTTVTLLNDGTTLNSSVSAAAYSLLPVNGRVVDAGAVSYFDAMPYPTTGTLGAKIKEIETDDATTNTRIDALRKVWPATLSGATYTVTLSPAAVSYTQDMTLVVSFNAAHSGAVSVNVNSLGSKSLKVYDSDGAKVDPTITARLATIAYDGTDFIILDQLPAAPVSSIPHGLQAFTANGTFTVPEDVTTIKVTCIGGGGGGGGGTQYYTGGIDGVYVDIYGTGGGGGACSIKYISTTGGTSYAVGVGAAGTASPLTNGGTTSFGVTTVMAAGGVGGGAGGSTGIGDLVINGTGGTSPTGGGASIYGPGYGGGGTAGYGSGGVGTNGLPGICVVEY